MRDDLPPDEAPLKLESVLYALSDPVRLHIVHNLAERGQLACYAAVAGLDIAKSTQSHHYRILREAGIIAQRKEGVCFITTLRKAELDARFPGLLDAVLKNFPAQTPKTTSNSLPEPSQLEFDRSFHKKATQS
jgi:DNA-binding transcriptional ArsR family regulator